VEGIPEYLVLLAIWHLCFFWKWYKNPFLMSTSEVLSSYFPQWCYMRGRVLFKDNVYYEYPASMPVNSPMYPTQLLLGWLCRNLKMDLKFRVFAYHILVHYLIASVIAFFMLRQWFSPMVCLFGAVTLVYNAYNIKMQTPSFVYSSCWIMGWLLPFPFGAICFGMSILGGYFPIVLVSVPILLLNPSSLVGAALALPQLIPFFWYYPRSIRAVTQPDSVWGRMPWKRYLLSLRFPENGIHYPEFAFNVGLCLILSWFSTSWWWVLVAFGVAGASGAFVVARIPARFVYLVSFSIVMASLNALNLHSLPPRTHYLLFYVLCLQCFLLWPNREQYPSFPFSQWWRKPSFWFTHPKKSGEWPYFSGYMLGERCSIYRGGFRLKEHHGE